LPDSTSLSPFFRPNATACCPIYLRTRDSNEDHHSQARSYIERLWQNAGTFVDKDAPNKAEGDMPAVWWELYLANIFLQCKKKLVTRAKRSPRNQGPDLLLEGPRIWVEAVMPHPNGPQPSLGQAYEVPDESILLRLTSAIDAKCKQFSKYREHGYTKEGEATIIAIAATRLNFNDLPIPRIVSAVLPVGPYAIDLDPQTGRITGGFSDLPR
jgi:hypothetical protein